jgi:hypothetical protein
VASTGTSGSASSASVAKSSGVAAPAVARSDGIHDAAQQVQHLRRALEDSKQRVGLFLGAGCPLGVYDADGKKSIVLIPAVAELTRRLEEKLPERDKKLGPPSKLRQVWDRLRDDCKEGGIATPTVEDILTELRTLASRRGKTDIAGVSKDDLTRLDVEICNLITGETEKSLPDYRCSYHRFASWIGGLQRVAPVEVFSPNYDLLFEQAFESHPLPHFDGFVGSREPYFDLASIEHDAIPTRWTRLWKLHGSINWEKTEAGSVVRVARAAAPGKVMIYPSHLKYDQSRRMPYLAMLDRLRAFFRNEPSHTAISPPLLVICGYSFSDDHLNEAILDGLRGNRKAHCYALAYTSLSESTRAVEYAEKQHNLTVLASDGAVIGNRRGDYRGGSHGGDDDRPWLEEGTAGSPGPRCQLGDFHHFGLFLEALCGERGSDAAAR